MNINGNIIYGWAKDLFPICRSITGPGVRKTLQYIKNINPELEIFEVKTGQKFFDWKIPNEWTIRDAYIINENGEKIVDFKENNLHVINYSSPINKTINLDELQDHLYSLPKQPDAIPYITSYYESRWGFCVSENFRKKLQPGSYRVFIDSDLKPGVLNYAEIVMAGKSDKEIFFSTYICHPSMANNELSGPVVATALIKWLKSLNGKHRYTYRFVFVPETIGSIVYISKNLKKLKSKIVAGFNLTCLGDEKCYSFIPSRKTKTFVNKIALHVLKHIDPNFIEYTWLDRGSDERQYCYPGVDLPIVNIMRSKHGTYPEYHTSLDNLDFITPKGLEQSYQAHKTAVDIIEKNSFVKNLIICEPQLGKRGLRPQIGEKDNVHYVRNLMNVLSYCDGSMSILDIADVIGEPFETVFTIIEQLVSKNLVTRTDRPIKS